MKIMVYTLGIPLNQTFSKRKEILDKKKADLKLEYPALNVMVIPGPEDKGDKVFVADMSYYGPTHPAGATYTVPYVPYYTTAGGGVGGYGGVGAAGATGGSGMYKMTSAGTAMPVTSSTANVVHYMDPPPAEIQKAMDDHSMFKMNAGPANFDSVTASSHDLHPLGENIMDFKPK